MTEVMERYKPEMVNAHDGVLYIRFVPDDAGAWVMHHQATELQARVAELERLVRILMDSDPWDYRASDSVTVLDVWRKEARAALEGKKDEQ